MALPSPSNVAGRSSSWCSRRWLKVKRAMQHVRAGQWDEAESHADAEVWRDRRRSSACLAGALIESGTKKRKLRDPFLLRGAGSNGPLFLSAALQLPQQQGKSCGEAA